MAKRILIKNGEVHDGDHFVGKGSLLIEGKKIVDVIYQPDEVNADWVIDAEGKIIAPGFIDAHNMMNDVSRIDGNPAINLVAQGVTSAVIGNCGNSGTMNSQVSHIENLDRIRSARLKINLASLLGHNTLRSFVVKNPEQPSSADQITQMCNILEMSIEFGGKGFSTGLMYAPGMFADRQELVALVKVVGKHNSIYTTHMRSEADEVIASVDEALETSKSSKTRLVISHLKVVGSRNQGKSDAIIRRIQTAREHQDVYVSFYPYEATLTGLSVVLPFEIMHRIKSDIKNLTYTIEDERVVEEKGVHTLCPKGWHNIVITSSTVTEVIGHSIADIAKERELTSYQTVVSLLNADPNIRAIFLDIISTIDQYAIAQLPYAMVGTDGYLWEADADEPTHPRNYGSFARVLREYVRERQLIDLETAIYRMTSLPAHTFRFEQRGRLKKGFWADVAVFSPDKILDRANYDKPRALAEGMNHVLVNGEMVYTNGEITETFGGVLL